MNICEISPLVAMRSPEQAAVSQLAAKFRLPAFRPGSVWLAGAGPGDPGLVTLLGLHAISDADAILYDALVNEELLRLAGPRTKRIFAGKRKAAASCKQEDISRMLVSLARKGARVLRLKGGDPFVFGRGGEEALVLARAGIPFRIVPGVTAGIGGLAYAGIPVTHRDINHVVTFVTGHGADGSLPDLDWSAIANGSPTLVLYMALAHAGEIAEKLIAAGREPGEPAAIVAAATLEAQSVHITTLQRLGTEETLASTPALIVVGENVRLREELNWLDALAEGFRQECDPPSAAPLRRVS